MSVMVMPSGLRHVTIQMPLQSAFVHIFPRCGQASALPQRWGKVLEGRKSAGSPTDVGSDRLLRRAPMSSKDLFDVAGELTGDRHAPLAWHRGACRRRAAVSRGRA